MNELATLMINFTVYSFIGWVCETVFCSFIAKKFVNRGFLNGPFCPIYGFGAVILELTVNNLPHNIFLVFFGGVIVTTTLEYLTAVLLEKMFHAKWWDYSHSKFNFQGRVCLLNSILFGLMSVALIFFILPFFDKMIGKIPYNVQYIVAIILFVYFMVDIFFTIKSMNLLNSRLEKISSAVSALKDKLANSETYVKIQGSPTIEKILDFIRDDKPKKASDSSDSIKEKIKALISDNKLTQTRLIKAFPQLHSTKYPELFEVVKDRILHGKNKK